MRRTWGEISNISKNASRKCSKISQKLLVNTVDVAIKPYPSKNPNGVTRNLNFKASCKHPKEYKQARNRYASLSFWLSMRRYRVHTQDAIFLVCGVLLGRLKTASTRRSIWRMQRCSLQYSFTAPSPWSEDLALPHHCLLPSQSIQILPVCGIDLQALRLRVFLWEVQLEMIVHHSDALIAVDERSRRFPQCICLFVEVAS